MFIILMNEDSTTVDSITTDSLAAYGVPVIINLTNFPNRLLNKVFYTTREISPTGYELDLAEVLSLTPFMLDSYGQGQLNLVSQRGLDPNQTKLFLNGHRFDNYLFGFFDLRKLPVQFIERMEIGENTTGITSNTINLISKVNHYDKPYSYLNYTTGDWGTNIYNLDFTRPITNDFGFYLSGLYWGYEGYRTHSDVKINSFYTNFYYNQFIPMRLDIIYFSNDYGIHGNTLDTLYGRGNDKFLDVCYVNGFNNHKITLYYNLQQGNYADPFASTLSTKNYGLNTESYLHTDNFEFIYGFAGSMSNIKTDLYGYHEVSSLNFWAKLNKSFSRCVSSISNHVEWLNTYNIFYEPKILLGLNIFDATYLIGSVSRSFRIPSICETYEPRTIAYPYYGMNGNSDLQPEYYWIQEFGIKRENFILDFYKYDFTNHIINQFDTTGYYVPQNLSSWQTVGIENYLELPIAFTNPNDTTSTTEISLGFASNYLFKGDSLPFVPKGMVNFFLSLKRKSARFTFALVAKQRTVSARQDISGQEMAPFSIFGLDGTIKFITLSCHLKIDNVFNRSYAIFSDYPMPPRSFTVSIKWEFWN